jgi:hypothetical protein
MSVFYANESRLFRKFTIQLMKERMKAIKVQQTDDYGSGESIRYSIST